MSGSRRIDDIEVLRGIAVFFVVLHHANGSLLAKFPKDSFLGTFYHWFSGGTGVDLFFAISGFVIARSLLPQYRQNIDVKGFKQVAFNFWLRRAFRLLPSAWIWLLITLALSLVFNDSNVFKSFEINLKSAIYAFLQIFNVRFAMAFMRESMGALFPYWSLSLEEQFYILFPFLALLPRRALVAALLAAIAYQFYTPRSIWHMAFRTDAICLGVLTAILQNSSAYAVVRSTYSRFPTMVALAFPVVVVMIGVSASKGMALQLYGRNAVSVFSFLAVLIASLNMNVSARIIPFHKIMIWIGARSYAIYLLHIPAFFIVREIYFRLGEKTVQSPMIAVIAAIALILLLAQLNYRFVETPLRRRGAAIAERKFSS